jgi:CRP/FNR family transcriptional regulator, anaerobic regulatory protein
MTIKDFIQENISSNQNGEMDLPFQTWHKTLTKGSVLTAYGQIEEKGYFLQKGIVLCEIEKDGSGKIVDIVFPNNFFCAYNSFISDEPSDIKVYALTDCTIEYLSKKELKKAYPHSIIANTFARYLKEKVLLKKIQREKSFLTKTKEEVYLEILNDNPEIIQLIPVNKIAQYLGVHPESLSRIRRKLNFLT